MTVANPSSLWLVRHGQSLGNVARDEAHAADRELLDLADRDMDVPLSPLGEEQATSFGSWLAEQEGDVRPDVILSSPYRRAVDTARTIAEAAGLADTTFRRDERLRERELGILDLLTRRGVESRYPEEAARRQRLGKFYHRPPGGESWVDVALRLRSWRDSIAREHDRQRVLVVTHEVVIVVMRYLIEDMDEATVLELSRTESLANCSLTAYDAAEDGTLVCTTTGWTAPVRDAGAPVTVEPDRPWPPVADSAAVATAGARSLDADLLRSWPIALDDDSDKFERGSVLVVGGSACTPGAVELAGIAALRAGAGRLQLATVASVRSALAVAVPEARVDALAETADGSIDAADELGAIAEQLGRADAVVLGSGMTDLDHTAALLQRVVPLVGADTIVVVDAQALACLAEVGPELVAARCGRLILTPNRGECRALARSIAGDGIDDRSDAEQADVVARGFGAVVSVFGNVATPDGRAWTDPRSVVGLATSGSGDVLAGLIGGIAAQCGDAAQAACWGTYAHLAAGAALADRVGPVGFLAREIAAEAATVLAGVSD